MKSSYLSYYEGYNKEGHTVFNGNGCVTVEHEGCIDPGLFLQSHVNAMLEQAKGVNPSVCRIVIKSLTKL